jgi:hypothetical protein
MMSSLIFRKGVTHLRSGYPSSVSILTADRMDIHDPEIGSFVGSLEYITQALEGLSLLDRDGFRWSFLTGYRQLGLADE